MKGLNFARKRKGRKGEIADQIPSKLTRLHCVSNVHGIFDLSGLKTPITANMKVDLHKLVIEKLKWGDTLPNSFLPMWNSHFEMIQEMKNIYYDRAVVPEDAVSLQAETLEFGDASKALVCIAIYIRFKKRDGTHSCQLLFARSRLVPNGMTQPRAELYAAVLNAHSGEVVRRALSKIHSHSIKFTDSQITLFWLTNMEKSLELWVRNRVVEAQRLVDILKWYYVDSENMIADIGTRPCKSIDVIKPGSVWIGGFAWMRGEMSEFPMMTPDEVRLLNQSSRSARDTGFAKSVHMSDPEDRQRVEMDAEGEPAQLSKDAQKTLSRYEFSNYIVDPNRHRYRDSVRLVGLVYMFIEKLRTRVKSKVNTSLESSQIVTQIVISDYFINKARSYYFKKGSSEVKHFQRLSQYKNISKEENDTLIYTGRLLPTDSVTIVGNATSVMKDLSAKTFNVPILDWHSTCSNKPV